MNIAYYDCAEIKFALIVTVSAVVADRVHHLSARVESGRARQAGRDSQRAYTTLLYFCTVSVTSISTAAKMKFAMQ